MCVYTYIYNITVIVTVHRCSNSEYNDRAYYNTHSKTSARAPPRSLPAPRRLARARPGS